MIVERRPGAFAEILLGLCKIGGGTMLDRMFWGSGGLLCHPQPALRAFMDFEFPAEMLDSAGMFWPVPQITPENKANILSGTYARLHGIDIGACKHALLADEFSRSDPAAVAEPWSTISMAERVRAVRAGA